MYFYDCHECERKVWYAHEIPCSVIYKYKIDNIKYSFKKDLRDKAYNIIVFVLFSSFQNIIIQNIKILFQNIITASVKLLQFFQTPSK